jgi:hypothetical protein
MIGKITIGKGFRGCLLYCLNDKLSQHPEEQIMKDRAEILLFNQCYGNQKELISQFNDVRNLNPKLSKPVLHITLSLAPGDQLAKEKLMEMCQDCAKDMGFENNQYVAIHHKDTNHQHLHIVANRIGFDKRTVSDSNNFQKIATFCRKTEMKFGLTEVLSPRKFLPKEQWQIPRKDTRKEKLKNSIQGALQKASNYQQFEQIMESLGYQVLKARGIAFIDDKKVKIKGSEVGFSLMTIEKILALKKVPQQINKYENTSEKQITKKERYSDFVRHWSPRIPLFKKTDPLLIFNLQKNVKEFIYAITEPGKMPQQSPWDLFQKRKKKKRKKQHH